MIAMCSVNFSRSAPATGMLACFSAWMTASKALPRRPHQYQHVAVTQRTALAGVAGHGAAFDEPLDLGLNAPGEPHLGARLRQPVEWRAPAFDVLPCVGELQFPELDQTRPSVREGIVDRIAGLSGMNTAVNILVAKHMIDRLQDRRSGPERIGERDRIEFQPGIRKPPFQSSATAVEFARRRALERKDRLLLVADREDRAGDAVARAFADVNSK